MSATFDDDNCNPTTNTHFQQVLEQSLANPARRRLLRGGFGLAALSASAMLPGCASLAMPSAPGKVSALGFPSLDKSVLDQVILPPGYSFKVLHASGDPLKATVSAYSNQGTERDDWSERIGDQHDGMDIYYVDSAGKYSPPPNDDVPRHGLFAPALGLFLGVGFAQKIKAAAFDKLSAFVATIFLFAIVFIVVLKNTVDWIWGILGLILFAIIIMSAVRIVKSIREKKK
jgi:hypothetical protein